MDRSRGQNRQSVAVFLFLMAFNTGLVVGQESTIRAGAVVDLKFDAVEGPAEDAAASGAVNDTAVPMNSPVPIPSPFWNVRDGQAVKFDAAKTQFFQVASSEDLSHTNGSTLSFYFLNLHELTDATFHGIVAKRNETNTNYGLNYQPSSGRLQVYLHDGTGYKVAGFPISDAFGVRRLVHLTATFRRADAPDPDADTEADDLEIRLYVNGKLLKPLDAPGGTVAEESGWFTDVKFDGAVNDAPLTIGSSFPNGEPYSGLVDEFLLFNRGLTSDEVSKLFTEIAGADGERLARLEREAAPSLKPVIAEITPKAVQIGETTRLRISGQNLAGNASLSMPGIAATATVLPESTAETLVVDVEVPDETRPTVTPLAVRTDNGLSSASPLPVERLAQRLLTEATNGLPIALPVALSGTLEGAERPRVLFEGRAGQRFVAEVESKRLGGGADPVLELKTEDGTPIEVAWGISQRGGDPRLVTTLPSDGRFVLELHDLAYKAPRSPVRLVLGELTLIDAFIPSAVETSAGGTVNAVGVGIGEQSIEVLVSNGEPLPQLRGDLVEHIPHVLPVVRLSDGQELRESDIADSPVDLTRTNTGPTYVTGELEDAEEVQRIALRVKPGQKIGIQVECQALGSSVEPVIAVYEEGKQIGRQVSAPGAGRAALTVTPKSADIELQIRDRFSAKAGHRLYRVRLAAAGVPSLRVLGLDSAILLPKSGRAVARFQITKTGNIRAVRLIPNEDSGIVIQPSLIPLTKGTQDVFVTIAASGNQEVSNFLQIDAEAETPDGLVRRAVEMNPDAAVSRYDAERPYFDLPIVLTSAAPEIELVRLPSVALKGITDSIGIQIRGELPADHVARFSLVTDEPSRPLDPKKPAEGLRPQIRLHQEASIPSGTVDAVVPLIVPSDVAATEVNAVIKVEIVPHAWSQHVAAVGYSTPFKLAVQSPIAGVDAVGSATIKPGENELKFEVRRQESFSQPVRIEIRGLPEGYTATGVDLAAGQSEGTLRISVPADAAAGPIANSELVVLNSNGEAVFTKKPFPLEVAL